MNAFQLLAATDDVLTTTTDVSANAAAGGFVAAMLGFGIFFWIIALVFGVFTIWMFIDSLMRSDDDYVKIGSGTKVMWALLIFFLGFIPAIIYFFVVRKKAKVAAPAAK
jgi:hypothetical protein